MTTPDGAADRPLPDAVPPAAPAPSAAGPADPVPYAGGPYAAGPAVPGLHAAAPADPGPAVPAPPRPLPASEPFEPTGVVWTPVSPRLATARLVGGLGWLVVPLVGLVVAAVLTELVWLWLAAAALAVVTGWVLWLVPRQVRALGYAERADDLLLRRGILFRSMVVVPYGRMQYVDVTAGPLARRFGIASVQLHTASPGTDASIDGLPTAEAARLRDQLASRGEARLAGL